MSLTPKPHTTHYTQILIFLTQILIFKNIALQKLVQKRIIVPSYNRSAVPDTLPQRNSDAFTTTCVFQKQQRRVGSPHNAPPSINGLVKKLIDTR